MGRGGGEFTQFEGASSLAQEDYNTPGCGCRFWHTVANILTQLHIMTHCFKLKQNSACQENIKPGRDARNTLPHFLSVKLKNLESNIHRTNVNCEDSFVTRTSSFLLSRIMIFVFCAECDCSLAASYDKDSQIPVKSNFRLPFLDDRVENEFLLPYLVYDMSRMYTIKNKKKVYADV